MAQQKKVVWLPYDFDTALGINNEGQLVFPYNLEDTDHLSGGADVFNGQESVMWNNLRDAFASEIRSLYQTLRSSGQFSYQTIENIFTMHQSFWPANIFNEDSWFKYLAPLEEDGNAAYLEMLQGSKAEQRRWWLFNRFKYLDSKYQAGEALTQVITIRGYAKSDITLTPYADIYGVIRYGSITVSQRATRGTPLLLECPLDNVNDTEIYIFSAPQLASVGDLSGFKVGYADFTAATKLQDIQLGKRTDSTYQNSNLYTLYVGNNTLLRTLDAAGCEGLGLSDQTNVDLSGCTSIENIYLDRTNIKGVTLPIGASIKVLHVPSTLTILRIQDQVNISEFNCPSTENITSLWLDNVAQTVDAHGIMMGMPAGSRVRLYNFDYTMATGYEVVEFIHQLDQMRGIDQNGNNVATAQVYGTIRCSVVSPYVISEVARYSGLTLVYDRVILNVVFYNYDETWVGFRMVESGGYVTADFLPTKPSTNYYVYNFSGWSVQNDNTVDANVLLNITTSKNVYACYEENTRYYEVRFYSGLVYLHSQQVAYGQACTYYDSTSGSNIPPYYGGGNADDYLFTGWNPSIGAVIADMTTYAQFEYNPYHPKRYIEGTMATIDLEDMGVSEIGDYAFMCRGRSSSENAQQLRQIKMPDYLSGVGKHGLGFYGRVEILNVPATGYFDNVSLLGVSAFSPNSNNYLLFSEDGSNFYYTVSFESSQIAYLDEDAFSQITYIFNEVSLPSLNVIEDFGHLMNAIYNLQRINIPNLNFSLTSGLFTGMTLANNCEIYLSSFTPTTAFNPQNLQGTTTYDNFYNRIKVLDLGYVSILSGRFLNFTTLTTLILRNPSMVTFSSTTLGVFPDSPQIINKIYVPNALLLSYKSHRIYESCFTAIEGSIYERSNS